MTGAALLGRQEPTHLWHPSYDETHGPQAVRLYEATGRVLDPWQKLALDVAMALNPRRTWLCFEFAMIISRQNGKGEVLIALELAWLFIFHEPLVIHTAHLYETTRQHFDKMLAIVMTTPFLRKRLLRKPAEGKGSEDIVVAPRHVKRLPSCTALCRFCRPAELNFMSRKGGAGRGFTGNKVVYDEAMYLDADMMAAGVPTMATRSADAQIVYAGSAGFKHSTQLAVVRNRGMRGGDPELGYLAWEIDRPVYDENGRLASGDDPTDPRTWAKVNPAIGRPVAGITPEYIRKEARALGGWHSLQWQTERLGVGDWPEDGEAWAVIGKDEWKKARDDLSEVDMTRPICLGIDAENEITTISLCGWKLGHRDKRHIEVIARHRGSSWVVHKLMAEGEHDVYGELGLWRRLYKPVVAILKNGLAAELITRLSEHPSGTVQVESPTETEYAAACGGIVTDLRRGALWHIGQSSLETALGGAEKRETAEKGWRWARDVATEQAPIVATTIAKWAHDRWGQKRTSKVW